MFMLEDLKKRKQLSDSLKALLENEKYKCHIFNGKMQSECMPNQNQAAKYMAIFESCDIALVGANHGNVMYPLFALDLASAKESAILNSYLSYYDKKSGFNHITVQNELIMLAIAISVYYPNIKKIILPAIINGFVNSENFIKCTSQQCIMYIDATCAWCLKPSR